MAQVLAVRRGGEVLQNGDGLATSTLAIHAMSLGRGAGRVLSSSRFQLCRQPTDKQVISPAFLTQLIERPAIVILRAQALS